MRLNRPLLAVGGGALLVILLGLGGVAYLLLRTGPLAERLIREAHALERATYPRPAHVSSPTPGTFARAMAPLMEEVVRAHDSWPRIPEDEEQRCREVSSGTAALDPLPVGCREGLERDRALMYRVLAATHAEAGGLPEGLRMPEDPAHPHQYTGPGALLRMVRMAALETRLLLAAGKLDEAVDTCLDTLALSREVSLGGGLLGRMLSATGYDAAYRPCAAALDAAPSARRSAFEAVAARHARAWGPAFLHLHGTYATLMELGSYQRFAERVERQRLQSDALIALAEVDAARAEQGRWPAALPPATAEDFTLRAPTPGEAHLTPRDTSLAELALRFSADAPPPVPAEPRRVSGAP